MGLKLWVTPPKVFNAETFPTVCFRSQPPPHARADDTANVSSVAHLAISVCSTEIQHVTLGILCLQRSTRSPAVTESARSFPLVIIAQATGGNQVRDGSFAPILRRHGGQSTSRRKCQDRSCSLALCSEFASLVESIRCWHNARESLSKRSVYPFLSKRSARWLRLFSCWCETCLEHRGRASFGSQNAQCNGVLPHGSRPLWCLRKTETRHLVQSHLARGVLFSLSGETIYGTARPLLVSLLN